MAETPAAPSPDELDALIPRYAGFARRTAAALADLTILGVIEVFVFWPIGWAWMAAPEEEAAWRLPLAIALGVPLLYDAALTSSRARATWGKRWTGIYVSDVSGVRLTFAWAALRHLAKYLSAATLGVGLLVHPFTYRKQALHDLLTRTVVRER